MKKFVLSNLLILVVLTGLALAFLAPDAGSALKKTGLDGFLVIVIFFCQGALLETSRLLDLRSHIRTLSAAALGAYVLAPVLGYVLGRAARLDGGDLVGFTLMCAMTPTIVSGIVMSAKAGGERDTAVLLTVVLNCVGLIAIPLNLDWTLRTVMDIDRVGMIRKILLSIVLPACAGQLFRHFYPPAVTRFRGFFKHAPVILLGAIVYLSTSSHAGHLTSISAATIGVLALLGGTVHLAVLFAGYAVSRHVLRVDEGKSRSVAVVGSQKSIAVAIPLWSAAFAAQYPLSLLPAIIFHLLQLVLDAGIANFWTKRDVARVMTDSRPAVNDAAA